MPMHHAVGLPADWLNAWLAAIGITVVLPDARLAWSTDPLPHAVVHHPSERLGPALYEALPTTEELGAVSIARTLSGHPELKRNVSLNAYRSRADHERQTNGWTLASTVTDLTSDAERQLPHSPFDVPAPRGITLWQRAVACREAIGDATVVDATLRGRGARVALNGLGFDIRRLDSRAENTTNLVLPVVELLAFTGLALYPVRGDGRRDRTRGWAGPVLRRGSFTWGVWSEPLDRWAVDAWLDRFYAGRPTGSTAVFRTVPFQPTGSADVTRAYATERRA